MIAALLLHPFPLWLAGREHGHDLPLAVTDAGKILHANPQAQTGGVQEGMRVSGALSRLPDLHTVPLSGPALEAAWAEVATTLPIYSPKVESLSLGRALLTLTPDAARELARALNGRIGLAGTRELALLAALNSAPGEVQTVTDASAFRHALPLGVLRHVGLSSTMHERLHWLGLHTLGDLLKWRKAQQAAYLGAEFTALNPYLHGANTGGVQSAKLEPQVKARLEFNEPIYEPSELAAAAAELTTSLLSALQHRAPQHLTVKAGVAGVTLSATRHLKEDIRTPAPLTRAILRTLHDADAARYGIETLEVSLTSLTRPAVQGDLWNRRAARDAADLAERRYPGVMRQVQWLDPHSLAADTAYRWIGSLSRTAPASTPPAATAQAVPHPTPLLKPVPVNA